METHELLITILSATATLFLGITAFFLKDLYSVIKKLDENVNKMFVRLSVIEERDKSVDRAIADLEARIRALEGR